MTGTLIGSDVEDELDGVSNTLLLAASFVGDEEGACIDLLRPDADDEQNVLLVSYTKSPDAQLRRWRAHPEQRPANLGIVSVEDSTRSVAAANAGGDAAGPEGWAAQVETVNNPNDLTGLGIRITEFLDRWDDDRPMVVCFDSLTALLQYVDLETAYEFLHIITGRLAATGAHSHFHMDPGAHEGQTVESVVSLMDAVVEVDDDGSRIRSRNI